MSKRRIAPSRSGRSRQPRGRLWLGLAGAILIVIVAGLTFWGYNQTTGAAGAKGTLPTPIGFPDTAQDVRTKVGQPAPAFILSNDTGKLVEVTPGKTGRPMVLVFNMGVG